MPLTEVYELLSSRRHVLTERFQPRLAKLANLTLHLANAQTDEQAQQVAGSYQVQLADLQREMNEAFGLDRIIWD